MFGQEQVIHTGEVYKRYDIGEVCLHGSVKVRWKGTRLHIQFLNYKTHDVQEETEIDFVDKFKVMMYLEDRMSHYYADKILKDFYA
jgi:hypothetical protein